MTAAKGEWTLKVAIGGEDAFAWTGRSDGEAACLAEGRRAFDATRRVLTALGREPRRPSLWEAEASFAESDGLPRLSPSWILWPALLSAHGVEDGKPRRTQGRRTDFASALAPLAEATARAAGVHHDHYVMEVFPTSPKASDGLARGFQFEIAGASLKPGQYANLPPRGAIHDAMLCAAIAKWFSHPADESKRLVCEAPGIASQTLRAASDAQWRRDKVARTRRFLDWMRRQGLHEEADAVIAQIKAIAT